jgi:hypothetical protein
MNLKLPETHADYCSRLRKWRTHERLHPKLTLLYISCHWKFPPCTPKRKPTDTFDEPFQNNILQVVWINPVLLYWERRKIRGLTRQPAINLPCACRQACLIAVCFDEITILTCMKITELRQRNAVPNIGCTFEYKRMVNINKGGLTLLDQVDLICSN